MNRCMRHVATLVLGLALMPLAHAQNLPGRSDANTGPIHRANPNSMQGTQPNAPVTRGIQTVPTQRTPTLENGGIGNRYPQRQAAPTRPATEPKAPTYDANGNRR
ncbi:hypothetical protein G7025_13575 [Pseudomonas lurida]|jgi:hypothetical protein|uniref:Lipoprotein n=1 Tax=Pseudomonas quebecensis TaxID=2995174 RepID=A0ABY6QP31_9PSED|nr:MULTISPECIES: hypothetical protein [Pseudomonas]MBA1294390.1 hypothetical protein [Pseudomonas lurida]MCX4067230.1 hypothetical protein [Pseudomonas quebecensis]UZW21183.1 hypothetical protein OSC50_12855 [Pseudomonas quebecensis]UZW26290.1 hypothetical protein OSC48_12625 [Pseudomonas quebecensis]UZW31352.1 hypothetical protein OSC49_12625 [Pseudomonas quebecensis]